MRWLLGRFRITFAAVLALAALWVFDVREAYAEFDGAQHRSPGMRQLDEETRSKVSVMLLSVDASATAKADALSELLIPLVSARIAQDSETLQVLGKEEFLARLGRGEAGAVECVGNPSCVSSIALFFDLDEVVVGILDSRDAADWSFTLHRLDPRRDRLLGTTYREGEGSISEIARALSNAVDELFSEHEADASTDEAIESGILKIEVNVAGAEVFLGERLMGVADPASALRVPLHPSHARRLSVRAEGYRSFVHQIEFPVESGQEYSVRAILLSEEPEFLKRAVRDTRINRGAALLFAGLGTATVGTLLAAVFSVRAQESSASRSNDPLDGASGSDRDRERRVAAFSFGLIAAGVVSAAAGGALLYRRVRARPAVEVVTLSTGQARAGVEIQGSF
ncbi:MAG: hypothetical protein AAF355_05760 [Myxococcota bacterium]